MHERINENFIKNYIRNQIAQTIIEMQYSSPEYYNIFLLYLKFILWVDSL